MRPARLLRPIEVVEGNTLCWNGSQGLVMTAVYTYTRPPYTENSMRIRTLATFCTFLMVLIVLASPAEAQDEPDPDESSFDGDGLDEPAPDPNAARFGVGIRLRRITVPKGMIELFMEQAASGVGQNGFGIDIIRRKGDVELSIGIEYDGLGPDDGYYVEGGGDPLMAGTTDFIEFDGLGWITLDASIIYHYNIASMVSLRYGGGLGFGYVLGDIIETDATCTGPDAQTQCEKNNNGAQVNEKQDFFRFPPVINVLGGLQFTPVENMAINLDLGMRTVFYFGLGAHYYF